MTYRSSPLIRLRRVALVVATLVVVLAGGAAIAQQAPDGATVYENYCVSCHGPSGGGGVGPALAGSQDLSDAASVVRQVLQGGGGMPAFAGQLSDAQIAAVVSHIRTSWGNDFGAVEPAFVAEVRGGGGAQDGAAGQPADGEAQQEAPAPEQDAADPPADGGDPSQDADQESTDAEQGEQEQADEEQAGQEQADEEQAGPEQAAQEQDDQEQGDEEQDEQPDQPQQPEQSEQPEQPDEQVPPEEQEQQDEQDQAAEEPVDEGAPEEPVAGRGQVPDTEAPDVRAPEEATTPDRTATLVVRVQPAGASVEVVGPTGFDEVSGEGGEMTFEDVPAGPYRVSVTLDGAAYVQLVDLTRGGRAEVVFELGDGGG